MEIKLSKYVVITDFETVGDTCLVYSTRSGKIIKIRNEIAKKLISNNFSTIEELVIDELKISQILVDNNEDEFESIIEENNLKIKSINTLSSVIQPTANCQLGCSYCGQVHSKTSSSDDVLDKTINRIKSLYNPELHRQLNITWYGGEPLTAVRQIRKYSEELIKFAGEKEMVYFSDMITNGLSFKPNLISELIDKYKIYQYQITIDTVKEIHDKRRITKEGNKTFDIIINNIRAVVETESFKKSGQINIRVNIDNDNYFYATEFIDLLHSYGLHEKKVKIYFASVVNWGEKESGNNSLTKEGFGQLEMDLIMYASDKGFYIYNIIPERSYEVCMVVTTTSEVYDANGNVYPCWEFPYTPMYENSKYRIGNLNDSISNFNNNAITRNWNEDIKKDGVSWCKDCVLLPVCGGGCPKKWYKGEPGCPPFKFNIQERLALYYIRQLEKNKK